MTCRIKEASKGYYHDLNMTRKHGGKTWIAPKVLIREDVRSNVVIRVHISYKDQKALYLPNITGKSLDERKQKHTTIMCFGRVTVLAMLGTQISEVISPLKYLSLSLR